MKWLLKKFSMAQIICLKMINNYVKLGTEFSQWLTDRHSGNLCFGCLVVSLAINAHAYRY